MVFFLLRNVGGGGVSLSHKKGPRYLCKNWRPISLLCVDYKIASRAIASRLKHVNASVVSPDQTACVSGRYMVRMCVFYMTLWSMPLFLVLALL